MDDPKSTKNVDKKKIANKRRLMKPLASESTTQRIRTIPNRIPNYESFAAKQMAIYKNQQGQEMFKERNKKFVCVDEGESSSSQKMQLPFATPILSMDFNEQQAIIDYERRCSSTTSFVGNLPGSSSGGNFYISERPAECSNPSTNIHLPPESDPRIPPPNVQPSNSSNVASSSTESSILPRRSKASQNDADSNKQTTVKQELVDEQIIEHDEVPSFQIPSSSNAPPPPLVKTEKEFQDDDKQKRKQSLLWTLFQEEMDTKASLLSSRRRVEHLKNKIANYHRQLEAEEHKVEQFTNKVEELERRKLDLLMGTGVE